jgi:hypothetical protein
MPEAREHLEGLVLGPRARRALWLVSLTSVLCSLVVRIVQRGEYYPGWDVLSMAQGLSLIATKTPREVLRHYIDHQYDPFQYWNFYGVLTVLLPGLLTHLLPWEHWCHVISLGITLLILWLVWKALRLGRDGWVILLAWGASSALLTQSLTGLVYISCCLSHALALYVVLSPALRQRWVRRCC